MCIIKSHTFINHPLLRLVIQKREINMHRDIQILSIYQFICISLYGNPIQYSCLENPMDRGAWQTTVHRVSKSQTWLKRQHMRVRAHTHTHTHTYLSVYLSIYLSGGFPDGSDGKESACNMGDQGSIPGSERSLEEANGYPFQYSSLGNSMDAGVWQSTVLRVTKSQTWLSN